MIDQWDSVFVWCLYGSFMAFDDFSMVFGCFSYCFDVFHVFNWLLMVFVWAFDGFSIVFSTAFDGFFMVFQCYSWLVMVL